MDWLEKHWMLVDCKENAIHYRMHDGNQKEIQGIKKPLQLYPITTSQMIKFIRKGCQLYASQVGFINSKEKTPMMENILIGNDFVDVFPEEIPGFPPRRDINFTIELIQGINLYNYQVCCHDSYALKVKEKYWTLEKTM